MPFEIGPYRVEQELARGAYGVVLRAQGPRGQVAIKLLLPERLEDPADVTRFHREGAIAARLQHPAIVPLVDRGVYSHGPYHVYAFVPGESLHDRIRRAGPLEPRRAAQVALELCGALEHAHAQGILHRDLKPANVLMTPAGEPRLTDFGLAQDETSSSRLTLSGEVMGSPVFMPPEQALGQRAKVGPASDVYGLGATLYMMLTGAPPIRGAGIEDTLQKVVREPVVSPATVNPTVPPALAAVCMRCLEKHPGDRYADMRALADDLRDVLAPPRPGGGGAPRRPALPLVLGVAGGLAASALVLVALQRSTASPSPSASAPPPAEPSLSGGGGAWPSPEPAPEVTVEEHLARGADALALHDARGAEEEARAALELDPDCVGAHVLLGQVQEERGDRAAAFAAWRRAAALDPASVEGELSQLYPNPDERRLLWITLLPEEGELFEAALLCNKLIDSTEVDVAAELARVDRIADSLRPDLGGLRGEERLRRLVDLTLERVVCGNVNDYANPDNSSLPKVLDSRQGVHITCALVLIALGRRLDVALEGVCFPGNFLARNMTEPPLFVDGYQGRLLPIEGLKYIFKKNTDHREFTPSVYAPSTRQEILTRLTWWQAGNLYQHGRKLESERARKLTETLIPDAGAREEVLRRAFGER